MWATRALAEGCADHKARCPLKPQVPFPRLLERLHHLLSLPVGLILLLGPRVKPRGNWSRPLICLLVLLQESRGPGGWGSRSWRGQFRRPEPEVGWAGLARLWRETVPGRPWLRLVGWQALAAWACRCLALTLHRVLSRACVSFHISPFCTGTRHAGLGPPESLHLNDFQIRPRL